MATEKTVTSAAPVVSTGTAKPSVTPVVAPEKATPALAVATKAAPVETKAPEAAPAKPAAAAPVEPKSAETLVSVKPAKAKTKARAAAKPKRTKTAKPKVVTRAKAPQPAKPVEEKLVKPAATPSIQPKAAKAPVSPFGAAEAINAEVTNATVQLNETISDFFSGGMDRSVRHLESVRNVKDLGELYSVNTKFFEAEFDSWMTASLKAFGTGSDLVGRVSAPMEEQVMSMTRTVKDRFAA